MKILYVLNDDDKYGAPKSCIELILNLRELYSIEPIVLTSKENKINEICNLNNIENYSINYRNIVVVNEKNKLKLLLKIIIRSFQYLLSKIKGIDIEKIIDMNTVDLIHSNTTSINYGIILAKKYNIPHIQHLRESFVPVKIHKPIVFNYLKMLKKSDYYISISNYTANNWIKYGLEQDKIKVIYNGLNFNNVIHNWNNDKKIKGIFVGSVCESKGQYQLIEALKKIKSNYKKNILVDIYGTGKPEYIKYLKQKLDDTINVDFKGYCNNVNDILFNYDVGFMCSKSEDFGRVTVEYMSNNLLVVASNTGANQEIIKENCGVIYNDVDELAIKIESIIDNKKIFSNMASNGNKYVREHFSSILTAKNVYNFYEEISNRG